MKIKSNKYLSMFVTLIFMVNAIFLSSFLSGCGKSQSSQSQTKSKPKKAAKKIIKVGIVTDVSGINGNETYIKLNESLQKLSEKHKIQLNTLQAHNPKDYYFNLRDMAEMGAEIIFTYGKDFEAPIIKSAEQYKNKYFCIIDGTVNKPNVISVDFNEHQGGFLAGVLAGKATTSNKLAFIGDVKNQVQNAYEYGFRAGVIAVNPKAAVTASYLDSLSDVNKAKTMGLNNNKNGADIIFSTCGKAGEGVLQAAKEKSFWIINVSKSQAKAYKTIVLGYVDKKIDKVVSDVMKGYKKHKIKGLQVYSVSLKDGMIDFVIEGNNMPKEIKGDIETYKKLITDEKVIIPTNETELAEYKKKLPELMKMKDEMDKKGKKSSSSGEDGEDGDSEE
jgi:basic membrane protein A